ncbi:LOW QUALITY PROTEIN: hypothetical protein Smp_119140 [Schistosoma mansoni]|uniref:hypothetical protein n=1 Tax=Schistosoma mansoni TaxID=6183 RepID=UPI00022DC432|nr:LOW QUALITY PROTEIN: hypothetical protein Smp_119140 [Schistosoma mansoni]|eukprot:XP_018652098.1 LOW QUALITY PROTEIN: hypothetical protein Smp_119140 [Schistosoma mansoni]
MNFNRCSYHPTTRLFLPHTNSRYANSNLLIADRLYLLDCSLSEHISLFFILIFNQHHIAITVIFYFHDISNRSYKHVILSSGQSQHKCMLKFFVRLLIYS